MTEIKEHIVKAKVGNQISFLFLLDYFWNDVYRFQLKRTNNEYEAEEITIQSFSRAFDKIATFNEDFKFKTWLITISKNIHIDSKRVKSIPTTRVDKSTEKDIVDETPSAEDQLITEQNLISLLFHIKQLKPHYQEVIRCRFFEEMSYKEIAETLDEPINNIKVKLLRAKKLLAESIQQRE